MEKEKLVDFDFRKIIPREDSNLEKKISKIVVKKFIFLSFAIAFGLNLSSTYKDYVLSNNIKQEANQNVYYHIAKENKEAILQNLELQIVMYDGMIQDVFNANKQIPNSAKTILLQSNELRRLSQNYKESIVEAINNFNYLVSSEDNFKKEEEEKRLIFIDTVKFYQIGSLRRSSVLEDLIISYTTTNHDEKEILQNAKIIREELKPKIIEQMNFLLKTNEITKYKKVKI